RCSWKSACILGAAARFSRMRSSKLLTSAGDSGSAFAPMASDATRKITAIILRMFQFRFSKMFLRQFWFNCNCRRQSEEDGRGQAPEQADGAGNPQPAQGRVMRPTKRTESCNRGQSRQHNRFHHSGKIARDIVAPLPN